MDPNDESFLKKHHIILSNNAISINNQTYYTKQINSLRVRADIVTKFSITLTSAVVAMIFILWLFYVHVALGVVASFIYFMYVAAELDRSNKKSMFHLMLTTSSGEVESFSSPDEKSVSRISTLIDAHIKNADI